jgi:transposase
VDTKEQAKPRTRRRHDEELNRQVLAQCGEPGASVAKVAMAGEVTAPVFVPLTVAAAPAVSEPPQSVDVELQRGSVHVRVRWPVAAATSCAAWLREILR